MADRLVYHWKHGWIPLTHAAALSKAHGNSKAADRYVPGSSLHGDHATSGKSARQIHAQLGQHAKITARPATYRGVAGHNITGADTKGRKVAVFVPGDRHSAQKAIDNLHAGRPAFDGHHASTVAAASASKPDVAKPGAVAPTSEREAFRMSGPDLRRHAAGGSTIAQGELDRRAGKKGDGPRQFTRPATKPERARAAEPAKTPELKPAAPAAASIAPAVNGPEQRKAESLARWESENRGIVPAGYTVKSRVSSTENGGQHMGLHSVYSSKDERVGSVLDRKNGTFFVLHNGKPLGDSYATRREAFAALTAKHEAVSAREAKKANAAAKRQAKATPVGIFQPHKVESDGTSRGDAAAAKVKQSFKYKDHTVHIETAMSKEQTAAFLGDVHSVLLKSGHLDGAGITFHVPSGDSKFRQTRRGTVGGYVRQGQRTIFVNPKIANGAIADSFGGPGAGDSFMAAARQTNGRQYVITHELGHVLDNQHNHTRDASTFQALGQHFTSTSVRGDATSLHREQRASLSQYGRSNVQEGYAEAYAQWIHGGPGSSPAADAFAARFGWETPKWYRLGRAKP